MSILTSFTLPLAAFTTFSSTGVSCLHGPHHSAQKSTSTGWRLDSSITSLTNVWVVVSLTPVAGAAVVSPLCNIVILSVLPRHPNRASRPDPFNWAVSNCRSSVESGSIAPKPEYGGLNGVNGGVCNDETRCPPASPVPAGPGGVRWGFGALSGPAGGGFPHARSKASRITPGAGLRPKAPPRRSGAGGRSPPGTAPGPRGQSRWSWC